LTHLTFDYNSKVLDFFYIYYMNKNIDNDATQKSELKTSMTFTQSFCEMLER